MVKREISLQNDLGELNRLNAFMEAAAAEWKLNDELLFQLNLVAEEVVSNIILHGLKNIRKNENILVELSFGQGELKMCITDHGMEFNPLTVPPPDDLDKPASERQIGGLGIYFIRQFMDNVEYYRENHCNVLILIKKVS
jgi:serine/threonine-protein kinase RsbW